MNSPPNSPAAADVNRPAVLVGCYSYRVRLPRLSGKTLGGLKTICLPWTTYIGSSVKHHRPLSSWRLSSERCS